MADTIRLSTNADELLRRFARLPAEMRGAIVRALRRALLLIESKVKGGAALKWRRGRAGLLGRLTSYAEETRGLGVEGAIGFRKRALFPYELAQEFGATARQAGALAIPITPEARMLSERGVGPRQFPRKLFIPRGTHVLAEATYKMRRGGRGMAQEITPHYALVKSIAPRLNFRQTVMENLDVVSKEVEAAA